MRRAAAWLGRFLRANGRCVFYGVARCRPPRANRLRRTGRSRREPSAGLSFRWFSPFRVFACAAYAGRAAYAAYAAVRRSARGKLSASPRRNAARGRRGCMVGCAAMPQDIPEERPSLMEGRMPQPYFAVPMNAGCGDTPHAKRPRRCASSRPAVHFEVLRCIRKAPLGILMIRIGGSERT